MAAIIEAPPEQDFTTGPDGPRAERRFWVDGVTWSGILQRLRNEMDVFRGSLYEDVDGNLFDSFLVCRNIAAKPLGPRGVGQPGWWFCRAEYAYPSVTRQRPQSVPGGPPVYWLDNAEVSEPAEFDTLGRRVVNAADEFPTPLPTVIVVRETLVIEWHQVAVDRFTLQAGKRFWHNRTNSAEYLGYPAECLRCQPVLIEDANVPPVNPLQQLFRIQARLEHRPTIEIRDSAGNITATHPGWRLVYPNVGTRIKTPGGAKPYERLLEPGEGGGSGVPVTQPVLLTPAGTGRAADGAAINYIDRRPYFPVDFSGLVTP